jgi:acyl-CoA dehydrogenase
MKMPYVNPEQRYGNEFINYARLFRKVCLEVDENPDVIFEYGNRSAVQFLLNDRTSNTLERTCYLEAYAYGDPGVVLACPGPSLSGLMIRELGTKEQIDGFYNFLQTHLARTFFALTEPTVGSDAAALKCTLTPIKNLKGRYYLNGEKCLFGNGEAGKIGVILARTHTGPLGIRAVLITPEILNSNHGWITRKGLPMIGLRGAQIAYMRFNNCPIDSQQLLGEHLRPMQHGMMAVIKTFNRLRTGVGALAIGQAQAVLDYLYESKKIWNLSEKNYYCDLYYQVDAARQLLINSAKKIDLNPSDSFSVSVSKVQATQIAEKVISRCIDMLDPAVLLENQWLAKCYRDSFAWEFMEGTKNMQLKNVHQTFKERLSYEKNY